MFKRHGLLTSVMVVAAVILVATLSIRIGRVTSVSAQTQYTIVGAVYSFDGNEPLSGVNVQTHDGSSAVTGADGTFEIAFSPVSTSGGGLTPVTIVGTETLDFSRSGFVTETVVAQYGSPLAFTLGVMPPPTNIVLDSSAIHTSETGHVTDSCTRLPLSGVVVSVAEGPSGKTGSDGSYNVRHVLHGNRLITFYKEGYFPKSLLTTVGAYFDLEGITPTNLDAALTPIPVPSVLNVVTPRGKTTLKRHSGTASCRLAVSATTTAGTPIAGLRLLLQSSTNRHAWRSVGTAVSDSSGVASKRIAWQHAGTFYYRWRWSGSPLFMPGTSGYTAVVVR